VPCHNPTGPATGPSPRTVASCPWAQNVSEISVGKGGKAAVVLLPGVPVPQDLLMVLFNRVSEALGATLAAVQVSEGSASRFCGRSGCSPRLRRRRRRQPASHA